MKKLLNVAAMALAVCGLMLTSCASGGATKSAGTTSVHPRSYVLDPADAGTEWSLPYNQYGPNYQSLKETTHYPMVKTDKPQAGDTIQIRAKFTSDIAIPKLFCHVTDQSAQANYWTILGDANVFVAENIEPGVPVEVSIDYVLKTGVKGDYTLCFVYDQDASENPAMEGVGKVNAAAKLTFEKVADSTDTSMEVPAAPHVSAREIDLGKYAAFLQIETNHPWVNGAQDMSVISNYQAAPEITGAYGEDLPKAGDTLKVTWTATSDTDISKLYIRPIDNSAAANWWKELINPVWGVELEDGTTDYTEQDAMMLFGENIVAGEPFTLEKEIKFEADAVAQVALCIWYDVGAGDGPAICTIVR